MPRILVVDDDPAILDLVAQYLAARGHDVLRARDGGEARELLDREREGGAAAVEVLITDLQMPVLDGLGLLAHVRGRANRPAVVMVSGSWSPGQRDHARKLGAARVYSKPADLQQLARDVVELAGGG